MAKKKATKKKATKKKATKKKATKKKATKKKASKKKASKKKASTKKKATKKKAAGGKSKPRGPQGKRLGAWKLLSKDDLFAHLKKTKTSLASLARTIGVSASVVHAWKAGRRFPSEEAQRKLAAVVTGKTPVAATARKARSSSPSPVSGKQLRAAREARKLSRTALAKQLGVSSGSVFNWESGKSAPRGENLTKVQAFLNAGSTQAQAPQAPALPSLPGATQTPLATITGGDAATLGAAQVASAYVGAGHALRPEEVIAFVRDLRQALA